MSMHKPQSFVCGTHHPCLCCVTDTSVGQNWGVEILLLMAMANMNVITAYKYSQL